MVKQFDVYPNPFASRGFAPLVVVLSSHLIDIDAAVIAPLFVGRRVATAAEVALTLEGKAYVLSLIDIAATPPARLRNYAGSLAAVEDDIRRGLDRLFTGF